MENLKRKKALFVAFIFGMLWFAILSSFLFAPLIRNVETGKEHSLFSSLLENASALEYVLLWSFFIVVVGGSITAIMSNIIGWLRDERKPLLLSIILYLVSLNIPAAVLCAISSVKLRQEGRGKIGLSSNDRSMVIS